MKPAHKSERSVRDKERERRGEERRGEKVRREGKARRGRANERRERWGRRRRERWGRRRREGEKERRREGEKEAKKRGKGTVTKRKPKAEGAEIRKPDDKIAQVPKTPDCSETNCVLIHTSESTRIDSLKLCETEHFLNWGNLRCFKIRPSTRNPGSALRRTVGRLRLSEPPHMTDLQIRQTRIRKTMRFFLFEHSKHLFNN